MRLRRYLFRCCLTLLACVGQAQLSANTYYEGTSTFRSNGAVGYSWMVQFLPYNPVIVECGAFYGKEVVRAAQIWPKGKVIAFEANPRAFSILEHTLMEEKLDNVKIYPFAVNDYNGQAKLYLNFGPTGRDSSYEDKTSLLEPTPAEAPYSKGPKIEVPCIALDDWCKENGINKIDVLRLDLEGAELRALQSSSEILKTVKLIIVQSFFHPYRIGTPNYFVLKDFLTRANFVPLAHWYTPGGRGTAVYISNELFDAYFVRCLGLGLGGLTYP